MALEANGESRFLQTRQFSVTHVNYNPFCNWIFNILIGLYIFQNNNNSNKYGMRSLRSCSGLYDSYRTSCTPKQNPK